MNLDFIGMTFQVMGEVMIAFTALRVHWRVRKEHRIDEQVFKSMRREHVVGVSGIVFVVFGYLLQLPGVL